MKQHSVVYRLIKASYVHSKPLMVERGLSIVFITSIAFAISYFFTSTLVLLFGFIFLIACDKYLTRGRGMLSKFEKNTFFSSALPLTRREKFYLKLYENIYDNFILYVGISALAVGLFVEGSHRVEQMTYFFVIFIHLILFTSIPMEFRIIDKNQLPKERSLKSIVLFLVNAMILFSIFLFFCYFYLILLFLYHNLKRCLLVWIIV